LLQHRQPAAVAFAAEAVVELALLGFVAAVDDDLVKLKRIGSWLLLRRL
jgi:hypothetical protein